jgi:hypothetical protein
MGERTSGNSTERCLRELNKHLAIVLEGYLIYQDKKPIMLLDTDGDTVYAYPYKDFKAQLSKRSQHMLARQYNAANRRKQFVAFVYDERRQTLISCCLRCPQYEDFEPVDPEDALPTITRHRSNHDPAHRPYTRLGTERVRRPGGGRKLTEVRDPQILATLEHLLKDEVAGDPMTEQRWVRSSLRRLTKLLAARGHKTNTSTVARLLKKMGFSLKANKRRLPARHGSPERDEQFRYIASQRERFLEASLPVISIDTKKTELIGEFMNKGRTWRREAEEVNEHDFPGAAKCRAVPFGIYDVGRNQGHVYVGVSNNTPEFAVQSIARWWQDAAAKAYPKARSLLVLADSGGSNGCRARAWKVHLQEKLCNALGLAVTVCHYPTGCSKWNPVEHRLFSFISKNWEGKPLRTLDTMLACIRGTTTSKGLTVSAFLDEAYYGRERKISRNDIDGLKLQTHTKRPKWNYTLRPAAA